MFFDLAVRKTKNPSILDLRSRKNEQLSRHVSLFLAARRFASPLDVCIPELVRLKALRPVASQFPLAPLRIADWSCLARGMFAFSIRHMKYNLLCSCFREHVPSACFRLSGGRNINSFSGRTARSQSVPFLSRLSRLTSLSRNQLRRRSPHSRSRVCSLLTCRSLPSRPWKIRVFRFDRRTKKQNERDVGLLISNSE